MASEINVIHEENGVRFKTEFFHEEPYTPSINNLHGNDSSPKKAVGTKKKNSNKRSSTDAVDDQPISSIEIVKLLRLKKDKERDEQAIKESKEIEDRTQENLALRKLLIPQNFEGIDEEEKLRVYDEQQLKVQEYEKRRTLRKIHKIQIIISYVSNEECDLVLKEHGQDEDEAVLYLSSLSNLHEVRKRIALKHQALEESAKAPMFPSKIIVKDKKISYDDADYMEREPMYVEDGRVIPVRTLHPSIEQYEGQIRIHYRKRKQEKLRKNRDFKGVPKPARPARLRLDEALASMDFSEWSEARRRAWQIKDKNANAYYYRFNDPGEPQRNGKWTKEERLLFFNRMAEIGVDGKWGIFSKAIPGRVGYQCSNFYRHLIENKEIEDKKLYFR